jgi:hypothetical protein
MYFSFDTPVNAAVDPKTGLPAYCGRAVFSDLHVNGNPNTNDKRPPPSRRPAPAYPRCSRTYRLGAT